MLSLYRPIVGFVFVAAQLIGLAGLLAGRAAIQTAESPNPVPPNGKAPRAVVLNQVAPAYTPEAQAAGLQGSVVLYLEVSAAGELEAAHVIQSLGMGLDQKALEAVAQWRFAPAKKAGVPVRVVQSGEVRFRLSTAKSWEIRRGLYQVGQGEVDHRSRFSEPVLAQYISPDPKTCVSDGRVAVVNFDITKTGRVRKAKLAVGKGEAAGSSALHAVSGWIFQPGTENGKPATGTGVVELVCDSTRPADASHLEDDAAGPTTGMPDVHKSAPKLVYKIEPSYTEAARRAGLSGKVVLSMEIDRSGLVGNMSVIRSLGLVMDEEAMKAVNQWRFEPGLKDGKPVITPATVEVHFRLR